MLPARFHISRDRSMSINDKVFAETVRLSFLTSQGTVDPARPAREIEAILRVGGGEITSIAGSGSSAWRSRIVARKAELHINRVKYPDIVVRARDRVKALARPGQPWFEVSVVDERGETRLVLQLGMG